MTARIAIGQFQEESSTFVLQRADLDFFRNNTLLYGQEIVDTLTGTHAEMGGFLDVLADAGVDVVPTVAARSVSSGQVPMATFDTVVADLLARLAAQPVGGVLLSLHGAMVLDDDHDGEGRLLEAVRERVGPSVPIVATLDLHGNITERMVRNADGLVGYDTYPHVDMFETGQKGARLLLRAVRGEARPRTMMAKVPMIVPAEGMGTSDQPMAGLMADAKALERRPGVLSTSLFAVQPWLDIPDIGFSAIAVVDGDDPGNVAAELRRIVERAWQARHAFDAELLPVDEAIARALALDAGPAILSESADGTGAGSPGDSAAVLERLLALGVTEPCLACVVDAPAVEAAIRAGVGSDVSLTVGGTLDPRYARPVPLSGRVRLLSDGRFLFTGSEFTGTEGRMGRAAVIQVGSISVLAMEQPTFTIDPAFYRSVGLEPRAARIVVVKSALQFRDNYGPFARAMWVVDTPGASTANLSRLTWRSIPRPLFPFDDDFEPQVRTASGHTPSMD